MARELIIVGAGGNGKNVAEIVLDACDEWNLVGFLDDDPKKQGLRINGVPVLGSTADIGKYGACYLVLALETGDKKKVFIRLAESLSRYATIVHQCARVSRYATVGSGSVVYPGVTVMANADIGDHVLLASKANVGHDTRIGKYVTVSALAAIAGRVIVEEGCFIGLNSSIREGVTVGKWSLVGMGSVVTSDVPAYSVVVGNPARLLRKLEPADFGP